MRVLKKTRIEYHFAATPQNITAAQRPYHIAQSAIYHHKTAALQDFTLRT